MRQMSGNNWLAESRPGTGLGLGLGRPVPGGGPLARVEDLPGGGVLAQMGNSCGTCALSAVFRDRKLSRGLPELAVAFPGFLAGLVLLLREQDERALRGPAHS